MFGKLFEVNSGAKFGFKALKFLIQYGAAFKGPSSPLIAVRS